MKKKNIPNSISLMRIAASPIVAAFMWSGNFTIGVPLYIITALTDFVDGNLARKWKVQSVEGKYLDMVADKIFAAIMLFALIPNNPILWVPLMMEVAIGMVNYRASKRQHNTSSAMVGKIKTAVLSFTMGVALMKEYVSVFAQFIPLSIISTLGYQIATLSHYIKHYKEEERRLKNHPNSKVIPNEQQITDLMRKSDLAIHFIDKKAVRKLYRSHLYKDYLDYFSKKEEEVFQAHTVLEVDEKEKKMVRKKKI